MPTSLTDDISLLLSRELESFERELALFPDDESIWRTSDGVSNSAANLALHVSGNLRHFVGAVMGDLSSRRGKIGGMTQRGDAQVVAADVPLSEMFGYSTTLRSMTQGRAVYSMQFDHYEEVPKSIAEGIITKQQKG